MRFTLASLMARASDEVSRGRYELANELWNATYDKKIK